MSDQMEMVFIASTARGEGPNGFILALKSMNSSGDLPCCREAR